MSLEKVEFVVQMTCESCVKAVKQSLENIQGIKSFEVNLDTGSVVVNTTLPADEILKRLETTGKKVVFKGYGSLAGVAILDAGSDSVQGVIRFVQQSPNTCIVDGTIDGLTPGKHQLAIHECGDLSNGCGSVGSFFNPKTDSERIYGDLGFVEAGESGRAAFRFDDNVIKLSEIIGRSLVVTDPSREKRLACGIIARSAGIFQNPKKICACDGVTIWDEKKKAAL